jgi:hypothetical protein
MMPIWTVLMRFMSVYCKHVGEETRNNKHTNKHVPTVPISALSLSP